MKAVGALFLALCVCVAAPVQAGTQSQILRDTTEDWHPDLWFATLLEPDFESVPALSFVGNGQLLSRVGGVFIVDEDWFVPFENLTEFNDFPLWIGFFDSYNDVQSNPMAGQQVAGPVNAGWQQPIAVTEYDEGVFYLEWDVLPLGLTTTAGQEHFVTLTPLNPDPGKYPFLTPYLLGSTVPDGPIDYGFMRAYDDSWEDVLEAFYGEGNRSAAVRIEAVPEPGCLTVVASGAIRHAEAPVATWLTRCRRDIRFSTGKAWTNDVRAHRRRTVQRAHGPEFGCQPPRVNEANTEACP